MRSLLNLLERFSNSLNKDTLTKEVIAEVILKQSRVSLSRDGLSLKNGVLEINTGASAKNEISLKESFIKEELRSKNIFISRILYK